MPIIYFASLINFHLLYCEGKLVTLSLKILFVFGQRNFEKKIVSLCLIEESVLLWMTSWHHTGCSQLVTSVIQYFIDRFMGYSMSQ